MIPENTPAIIREAAQSPLGILALMVLLLGIIGLTFFKEGSERAKLSVFALLFVGVAAFGVAITREGTRIAPNTTATAAQTAPASGTTPTKADSQSPVTPSIASQPSETKVAKQRWAQPAGISTDADLMKQQRPAGSAETGTSPPRSGARTSSALTRHDEITVSKQGRGLPDVVAAADDALNTLRSQDYSVRGHLRSTQSQPDTALAGLITTDLTLDVRLIDMEGVVRDAFTITSRGGGFTSDSSALQARDRLRHALHERLQKEHL